MNSLKFAKVAVDDAVFGMDKLYDYRIPPNIAEGVAVGCRVIVPFGRSGGKRQGIILQISDFSELKTIKPITALLDLKPILTEQQLELVYHLKETTFCTYFDAVKAILPAGLNYRIFDTYTVNTRYEGDYVMSEAEQAIYDIVKSAKAPVSVATLLS